MQSLASLMSSTNSSDIAPMEDLEGEDEALLAPAQDHRKLSEVSNYISQIDSLITSLSENPGSPAGKSDESLNNSVVEELPEESPVASDDHQAVNKGIAPPFVSPIKAASPAASPLLLQTLKGATPDRVAPAFPLDLSRITERTEHTDGENQSSIEVSQSTTTAFSSASPLVGPEKKLEFDSSVGTNSFYQSIQSNRFGNSSHPQPQKRSVFSIVFGCLFPFCRF
ncbi:unnamed protein product [Allacma fusca]|uniref:Uncharacterized protein n=1 Tax=Allacma fusca TaxID=39272 RepID=A0A8J2NKX0_9HEXA|nr:unnamed protein product [Allacma fusca]